MGNLAVQLYVYIVINLNGLKGKRFTITYDVRTFLQVIIPWTVGKPLLT